MLFKYQGNSKRSGIYKITCLANGSFFIGSAKEFKSRWKRHIQSLNRGTNHNKALQRCWNRWGENRFIFEVVKVTDGATTEERRAAEENLLKKILVDGRWDLCLNFQKPKN